MVSNEFPNVTASGQQYNIGEKPSVILYTYIKFVVDSHNIWHIVIATEETTMAKQVSHNRHIKCQSRSWSRRYMKANGSHHDGKPLLRPTAWIQMRDKTLVRSNQPTRTSETYRRQNDVFGYKLPGTVVTTVWSPASFSKRLLSNVLLIQQNHQKK